MRKTAKYFSYLFHPITVPFLTTLVYFTLSHFYFSSLEILIISGQVLIMTCLLPICVYYLLKSLGLISTSIMVSSRKERVLPFMINIVLLYVLKEYIFYNTSAYTIRLYFWGLMNCYLVLLLFALLKQKSSVHIATLTTSLFFYIHVLIELQQPHIIGIIGFIFIMGFVASSRLFLRAHSSKEIIQGFCIGTIPSIIYIISSYNI